MFTFALFYCTTLFSLIPDLEFWMEDHYAIMPSKKSNRVSDSPLLISIMSVGMSGDTLCLSVIIYISSLGARLGQARDCSVPNTRADLAGDKYTSYYYHESSISQRKRIIQNSFSTFSKQVFGKILSLSIQFNEIAE